MPDYPGSLVPSYNAMQANTGVVPGGIPGMPPVGIQMGLQVPQTMHPGQVASMLQQQSMMSQYITPPPSRVFGGTQLAAPGMFGPALPAPLMGNANMARQQGIEHSAGTLGAIQGGMGTLARVGFGIAATAALGPLGGFAADMLMGSKIQDLGAGVFAPVAQARERALAFQNMSNSFVTGGPNLSATGQGFSAVASQQITSNIARMSGSHQFQRETGGMFNRGDIDRITRLAGEYGMLDQSQSVDRATSAIKQISKSVYSFMKLADEPDLKRAMEQVAKMRTMGFTPVESMTATANARTFARMAGVGVQEAMQGAMVGAQTFQQVGLSGAAGFQAGLGSMGMARAGIGGFSTRQLALAGGVEGIQQSLMQSAATEATRSALNFGMMRIGANGRLELDRNLLPGQVGARGGIQGQVQRSAALAHRLGSGGLQDAMTQMAELQDRFASEMGESGINMVTMANAADLARGSHGRIHLSGALLTMTGGDERRARNLELLMQNPEFFDNIRQQQAISRRERAVTRRNAIRERSSFTGRMGDAWAHGVTEPLGDLASGVYEPMSNWLAEQQDREEQLATQGEGPATLVGRQRDTNEITIASQRARFRGRERNAMLQRGANMQRQAARRVQQQQREEAIWDQTPLGYFHGAQGWGLTRESRGGDSYRDTVLEGADLSVRARNALAGLPGMGPAPTAQEIERIGQRSTAFATEITRATGGTVEQQSERVANTYRDLGGLSQRARSVGVGAAAAAITSYADSRNGMFGLTNRQADPAQMRRQVVAALRARGVGAEEAQRMAGSTAFMDAATQAARESMTEGQQANLDATVSRGQNNQQALSGMARNELIDKANAERDTAREALGLNIGANSSERDASRVFNMIGQSAENDGDLRRKIFAALMMEKSTNRRTREAGIQRLHELEETARDKRKVRNLIHEMRETVRGMETATQEDIASRFSGKSVAQAEQLVNEQAEHELNAQAASGRETLMRVLGDTAGRIYADAGNTPEERVAALRRNKGEVRNERIRALLDRNASTQEIEAAVTEAQDHATRAGGEAVGAGEGEQTETERISSDLADSIQASLGGFPGAVTQFKSASEMLRDAADALRTGSDYNGIHNARGAGGGDHPGFAP